MRSEYLPLLLGPELAADLFPSNKTKVIMMFNTNSEIVSSTLRRPGPPYWTSLLSLRSGALSCAVWAGHLKISTWNCLVLYELAASKYLPEITFDRDCSQVWTYNRIALYCLLLYELVTSKYLPEIKCDWDCSQVWTHNGAQRVNLLLCDLPKVEHHFQHHQHLLPSYKWFSPASTSHITF